jgi:uncharacterized membrane protein
LTVLLCLLFPLFVPFYPSTLTLYILLATFSTLFVTKDEFVHKEVCSAEEQWLHALLFILHPITLIAIGLIWPAVTGGTSLIALPSPDSLSLFVQLQLGAMTFFFLYQIIFWNFIWDRLTTRSTTNSEQDG